MGEHQQTGAALDQMTPQMRGMIEATFAEFKRVSEGVTEHLPPDTPPLVKQVVIAENVIRVAMEATFNASMVNQPAFFVEMALRLASYSISAMPPKMQGIGIREVIDNLHTAHAGRVATGVVIDTFWDNGTVN